ncbi:hypothetical protein C9F11_37550 [Streptomyces sp. YIM 121038]|uniref:hypothetical protein n=1 Tax=Streptomyces sp. YIM 121038 TaxID=2136401 RepID=UPI001110A6CB|nr:hypothetical protein [Streptomyces sp. YIM 121038]QCX81093.1 hypothetical protein C9F11_37550 [Streptomyces sp. YIM 121038]
MTDRHFTREQLAALGVPPDQPDDVEYSDVLLADEHVTNLKYTALRRVIFTAPDDGRTYAVEYQAPIDVGDFEVGDGGPDDYGWYGPTVEAVEVEERPVVVQQWVPVDEPSALKPCEPYRYTDADGDYVHIGIPGTPDGRVVSFYTPTDPVYVPVAELDALIAALHRLAAQA